MEASDHFARIREVVPVDAYQTMKVVVVGAGSVGSPIVLRLAQHGVRAFVVIDPDRVEWENPVRHFLGAESVGQYKAEGIKAVVEGHVPGAVVAAITEPFGTELGPELLEAIFENADLLICSTDDLTVNAQANRFALAYDLPAVFPTVDAETGRGEVVAVLGRRAAPCYECYIHWRRQDHENRRGISMALATMEPTHGFVERLALGLLDRESEFFSDIFGIRPAGDRVAVRHPPTVFWVTRPEAPRQGPFEDGPWLPMWADFHPECPACAESSSRRPVQQRARPVPTTTTNAPEPGPREAFEATGRSSIDLHQRWRPLRLWPLVFWVVVIAVVYEGCSSLSDWSEQKQESRTIQERQERAEAAQQEVEEVADTVMNSGSAIEGCALLTDHFIKKYSLTSRSACESNPAWKDNGADIGTADVTEHAATVVTTDDAGVRTTLKFKQRPGNQWRVDEVSTTE